jgi:urease accessory protein
VIIRRGGRDVFRDHLSLRPDEGSVAERMRPFVTYGVLILFGPRTQALQAELRAAIDAEPVPGAQGASGTTTDPIMSVTAIDDGRGAVIRCAGREFERAAAAIGRMLRPLHAILGGDPWARRGAPLCI